MLNHKARAAYLLATVLLLPTTYVRSESGDSGLIAHWLFTPEHVSGGVAVDLVGNWDGKLGHNVSLVDQPPCLQFEGKTVKDGDRELGVTINNKATPQGLPHGPLTLETWARIDEGIDFIALVGFLQDTGEREVGWYLGTAAPDYLVFGLSSRGNADVNGTMYFLNTQTPVRQGHWFHLVGTYDGHLQSIYLDGKLRNQTRRNDGYIDYPLQMPFTIGSYRDENESHPFHGFIHEIRIYDRALNSEEVAAHFQAKRDLFQGHSEDIKWPDPNPGTIRTWALSEPYYALETDFEHQFDVVHAPETDPESVHWDELALRPIETHIDLAERFPGLQFAAVYACTFIHASRERDIRLLISHDDGVKVWLNGEKKLDINRIQKIDTPPSQLTVKLRAGWNQLMVKVVNASGDWGLRVRAVKPENDQPAEGLEFSATPLE